MRAALHGNMIASQQVCLLLVTVALLCLTSTLDFTHYAGSVCEQYPLLEQAGIIDLLMPKKEPVMLGKWCAASLDE